MISYTTDPRIILTLDTGGTNMVFGAMQRGEFIVEPLTLPAYADDLDKCLSTMVEGFRTIIDQLDEKEGVHVVDIDLNDLAKYRGQIPILAGRRTDLYRTEKLK